jgi:hypothetical protein
MEIQLIKNTTNELSNLFITTAGKLVILNSGGTGASEGGMGSGSKSENEKGQVGKPDNQKQTDTETENTFDPVKKDIDKAEQENKERK